ncbi:MAG: 6-bladed beta-propeller [Candidatus Aminicenantes bacterium]|nr:6-bladed beta-propeller [Candidatus Aminicenantes bacterium]
MRKKYKNLQFPLIMFLLFGLVGSAPADDKGEIVWSVTYFGEGESDYFHRPSDIEIDLKQSLVYIADSGNQRIVVFDLDGNFVRTLGQKGQGPGEFNNPTGLCVDDNSRIVVADYQNNRIQIFSPEGKFLQNINTKEVRVADLLLIDGLFYTISSFGSSGFNISMGLETETQPLVVVLNDSGDVVSEITIADFPETQPFVRALKNRVCLSISPDRKLFLPFGNMNLIMVFNLQGDRLARFERELPFKPITPSLKSQKTSPDGEKSMVQMVATIDMVSRASHFGPDGKLYILSYTESLDELMKGTKDTKDAPAPAQRFDVIDPKSQKLLRTLSCESGARAFGVLESGRIIYMHEDDAGELVLKCVQY